MMNDETHKTPADIDLPTLFQADLTREKLKELLVDIESQATWWEVRLRQGPMEMGKIQRTEIAELEQLLSDASGTAAQIRYHFDGKTWCDSIQPNQGQYRLVRMEIVSRPEEEQS